MTEPEILISNISNELYELALQGITYMGLELVGEKVKVSIIYTGGSPSYTHTACSCSNVFN